MVVRTCRMVSSMSGMAALSRSAILRAVAGLPAMLCKREADGEQPLDDRVVEVPGHPVAVLVDGHLG